MLLQDSDDVYQFTIHHSSREVSGLHNTLEGVNLGELSGSTTYAFQLHDDDVYRAQESRTRYFTLVEPTVA